VRKDHPLCTIREMVDEVLSRWSRRFDTMYAKVGRPSIAPGENLLRAQMLYSIRSERDRCCRTCALTPRRTYGGSTPTWNSTGE
jgi:transposase